ncbi:hypothetical protein KY284_026662 [Solanum tuberosum]|nr:hypothetical protein KY284_026662 [Solanum tuberosum]
MSQLAALVYSNPKEELMDHMNVDAMNATQTSTVVTRGGKLLQNALIIDDHSKRVWLSMMSHRNKLKPYYPKMMKVIHK